MEAGTGEAAGRGRECGGPSALRPGEVPGQPRRGHRGMRPERPALEGSRAKRAGAEATAMAQESPQELRDQPRGSGAQAGPATPSTPAILR